MALVEDLEQTWRSRLQADHPHLDPVVQTSIINWLLGEDQHRFDTLTPEQLDITQRAMDYRYRILRQRYLDISAERAYGNLIKRLSSLFLIRNKVRTWIALSRDRQRTVRDVLQEVIQEMLLRDRYLRQQIEWIHQCTASPQWRNLLMLASAEEYCLRPIRNQPLLVYRFVNYLRRSQQSGMTQVPTNDLIRLVSDEIGTDNSDSTISLLDNQAIADYQDQEFWQEQQAVRSEIKQTFLSYLQEKVDEQTATWLELHLQGFTQERIAQRMKIPVREAYRLREKVSYHAVRVFTLKHRPDLVMTWLGTSLQEHNLGLTPEQWQRFWAELAPEQKMLLDKLQNGKSVDDIAKEMNKRTNQVMGEWSKLYLEAQTLRNTA